MVTDCRNCGAALEGRYCSRCGQDSRDPPEDVWGLFGFFAARFAGVESRALRSVSALLFRPGQLTRAFLDGRRAAYSGPVQIYLWCTAAFFVIQTFFPIVRLDTEEPAVAVGVLIDQLRGVFQGFIDGHNRARNRGIDIRGRFYRFNNACLLGGNHLLTDFGVFHVNHVTQRILGMIADAHGHGSVFFCARPLVAGRVSQFGWYFAHIVSGITPRPPG